MQAEDMTTAELYDELDRLEDERDTLSRQWMVDDVDGEWDQVNREIERISRILKTRGE